MSLQAEDLTVAFQGRAVLGPLTGDFGAGVLFVLGPAQSGKTTLLKALCGLVAPAAGRVRLDGVDLAQGPEEAAAARAQVGMVFQTDALFDSLDALANVALPLLRRGVPRAEARERAQEALVQVGLGAHARDLPERLSGGMRKRLGLARAIVARPRYLFADDPFAGLDPGTVEKVRELMLDLWGERGGLLLATADPTPLWAVPGAEALVLQDGRSLARGPVAELRQRPEVAAVLGEAA